MGTMNVHHFEPITEATRVSWGSITLNMTLGKVNKEGSVNFGCGICNTYFFTLTTVNVF